MPKTKDEKETAKQEKIEVSLATPEEVEFYRAKYLEAMAKGPPKIITAGFDITFEAVACAVENDSEARCALKPAGRIIRSGAVYDVTGELSHVVLADGGEAEAVVKIKVRKSHAHAGE